MSFSRFGLRKVLLTICLAAYGIGFIVILGLILSTKPAPTIKPPTVAYSAPALRAGLPTRLRIPKIKVDTALDYIGLTAKGDLDAPSGPNNAAWYERGPRPGEIGNAVIDGHFGYKNNLPAVFDNLHLLQTGDQVIVDDENGVATSFTVSKTQMYGPSDAATAVFISKDGKAHLNLITCQGVWNEAQKGYSNRLVVFADQD